jgi:hypothetical protein
LKSGRWVSNPRPSAWEAAPTKTTIGDDDAIIAQAERRVVVIRKLRAELKPEHPDLPDLPPAA